MRQSELKSRSMHLRFFQAVDEENLLNRIDNVMTETGVLLTYDMDLRTIMYLSDKVESRKQKRLNAKQNTPSFSGGPR